MQEQEKTYIAFDLKSFYASVECLQRGLDPMTTNLVVADQSRTEKTICLAVSPSLKSYGIPGRPRLFEVVQRVREVNRERKSRLVRQGRTEGFAGASYDHTMVQSRPELALDYIVAPPRMALYMEASTRIYDIYLKYAAPEDIHVYSIDEVFIDVTDYLPLYQMDAGQLAEKIIRDVLETTGITAAAGIGPNLYLCKIAMDIMGKKIAADENGVRIACLDEISYRKELWSHRPLTDFWRVGKGYARKLESVGLFTMGDVARCSIGKPNEYYNEDLLYDLFGKNAELLIDHAWGWEPCTIAEIKAYRPSENCIVSGQVLQDAYPSDKARLVVREMTDLLVLDLVDRGLVTDQLVLTAGYDIENLTDPERRSRYRGEITTDRYGRKIPKHAHGTVNLEKYSSSTREVMDAVTGLFDRIVNPDLLVRRISISANRVIPEQSVPVKEEMEQLDLFTDYAARERERAEQAAVLEKEKQLQQAVLSIKKKYGKNAILKGMNLEEGATARNRNSQIGGHRA